MKETTCFVCSKPNLDAWVQAGGAVICLGCIDPLLRAQNDAERRAIRAWDIFDFCEERQTAQQHATDQWKDIIFHYGLGLLTARKLLSCRICDQPLTEPPALSRRDNQTLICPACGTREAIEDWKDAACRGSDAHLSYDRTGRLPD